MAARLDRTWGTRHAPVRRDGCSPGGVAEKTREWSATLADARATAAEVVQQVDPDLVVTGANSHHDSTFVELLISDNSCRREPCRVLVSLDRSVSERVFRKTVEAAVKQHIIR